MEKRTKELLMSLLKIKIRSLEVADYATCRAIDSLDFKSIVFTHPNVKGKFYHTPLYGMENGTSVVTLYVVCEDFSKVYKTKTLPSTNAILSMSMAAMAITLSMMEVQLLEMNTRASKTITK